MDISALGSSTALAGNGPGVAQALDRDAFMKLLVTQLENQDPLSPVQNEDFVAQLATFSSLSELEELNDSILAMITLNQSNALLSQLTQGSALIGKQVNWTDPVSGESRAGTVDTVRIEEGLAILRIGGEDVPLAAIDEILGEPAGTDEQAS
jgi:flagellar basal-body rod modification protein FlgD